MELQELKNSRTEIITHLTEKVGAENIKDVMQIMVNGLDCCDSLEELIDSSLMIFEQSKNQSRRKVSKLATLIGKINEIENN